MIRSKSVENPNFDLEIERTLTKLRRARRENQGEVMAEPNRELQNRALRDYALPQSTGMPAAIRKPAIAANNFEIKPALL